MLAAWVLGPLCPASLQAAFSGGGHWAAMSRLPLGAHLEVRAGHRPHDGKVPGG